MKKYEKVFQKDYETWYGENEAYRKQVAEDPDRLAFHLMPETGWMNDPNGLCQFKGEYHIYYQYPPFEPTGELKLWGHYKTKDLVTYEQCQPVLFPDSDEDAHGVYSGSAFCENGKINFFYTGNVKLFDRPDYDYINSGRVSNTMYVTSEDGMHFSPKKCLMTNSDYPADISAHVRDPKIIKREDGYYMVLGARDKESKGLVLVYRSDDLTNWKYHGRITTENAFGYMWECPDYFKIGDKKLLSTSVQGLEGGIWEDRNVYQSGYFEIEGDILGEYKLSEYHLWDYGFDYYAPQSFETEDGRRIHISWMGMPDCEEYSNPTIQTGWQHCFTFPREIFEKDGKICQRPIRELEEKKHLVSDVKGMLAGEGYPVYEMTISDITKNRFKVILSEKLILDYADGKFRMHFTDQDKTSVSSGRSMRYVEVEEVENLKILADTSSVEVFVNDGEYVFSTRYYPEVYKLQAEAVGAQITLSEIM